MVSPEFPEFPPMLSSSNSIHSSVKPENFMAMVETLREYGEYPIGNDQA